MIRRARGLVAQTFAVMAFAALALAPAMVPLPASAHQQKIAVTTVSVNPRSDRLELVHQVPVHDAEHALRVQGIKVPDIVGSPASREDFARYIAGRFRLEIGGAAIKPDFVGSEIKGGNVLIYQETPAPEPGATIRVNSQILTDVWARQENRVNIGSGTAVTTLVFTAGNAPREAILTR